MLKTKQGLVTIIAPCYNKGDVCGRFIQSVIAQTYRPIQLIIVNDGSTDNSDIIIRFYQKELECADIDFHYIIQENAGVGAAVNTALKNVEGEFLCWPDIDDWYSSDATKIKVDFLQQHQDFGIVSSDADIYYESDMSNPVSCQAENFISTNDDVHQFYHVLQGQSIVCPGCHMVRTEALYKSLGRLEIFPSRYGQNLQILYPVYYHYKRGYVPKALYHYVVYENSHSHFKPDFAAQMQQREGRYEIKVRALESIQGMQSSDFQKSKKIIDIQEAILRLNIAYQHDMKDLAKTQIKQLQNLNALNVKHLMQYWGINNFLIRMVFNRIW